MEKEQEEELLNPERELTMEDLRRFRAECCLEYVVTQFREKRSWRPGLAGSPCCPTMPSVMPVSAGITAAAATLCRIRETPAEKAPFHKKIMPQPRVPPNLPGLTRLLHAS